MKSEPSILVVGAGPVGMTAAIELQRRGFHPRVIDRAKEPAGESRALVIHARSLEIFEPSGVAEKLLDAGHEVQAMVLATADRELARLQFTHSRQRFNYLLLLPQQETERILLSHLQERGIEIEWQTELSELKQTEMGVECRVRGEEISTYDLVIGTDGARSTVRECLGIDFTGSSYEHDWTLADIRFRETRPVNEGRVKVLDGAKITYFPFTPNFGRFIYSGQDGMRFFAEEVQVEEVVWESSFRISHRIVESYQRGNVFLAGDAAHVHSPVGGARNEPRYRRCGHARVANRERGDGPVQRSASAVGSSRIAANRHPNPPGDLSQRVHTVYDAPCGTVAAQIKNGPARRVPTAVRCKYTATGLAVVAMIYRRRAPVRPK